MDFLQNLDPGTVLLLVCGLCIVGIILLFVFQFVGGFVDVLGNVVDLFTGILSAGPLESCGCFLLIGGCGVCALVVVLAASALNACGTNPTNFCALFGR
jgi:hypothetical protein